MDNEPIGEYLSDAKADLYQLARNTISFGILLVVVLVLFLR